MCESYSLHSQLLIQFQNIRLSKACKVLTKLWLTTNVLFRKVYVKAMWTNEHITTINITYYIWFIYHTLFFTFRKVNSLYPDASYVFKYPCWRIFSTWKYISYIYLLIVYLIHYFLHLFLIIIKIRWCQFVSWKYNYIEQKIWQVSTESLRL